MVRKFFVINKCKYQTSFNKIQTISSHYQNDPAFLLRRDVTRFLSGLLDCLQDRFTAQRSRHVDTLVRKINPDIGDSAIWRKFHQRFTSKFFVRTWFWQLFQAMGRNSYKKFARKTLMKTLGKICKIIVQPWKCLKFLFPITFAMVW